MTTMPPLFSPSTLRLLALLGCLALCGCSAFETARVVSLDDVPDSESVWRPEDELSEPLLVDTTAALVAKRQLATAISVEPSLEAYVERMLEDELGLEIERLRVDYVGYRFAPGLFDREDDFVVRVELHAPTAGIQGEFLGVVSGREMRDPTPLLGPGWPERIPDTGVGRDEDDQTRAIERRADQRAWLHRAVIQEATRRLTLAVARR